MPSHAEKRVLPYAADLIFDLVADIDRYPEFLPWCVATRILERRDSIVLTEMEIGFRFYRERFTTRVALERPRSIHVTYAEGPFKHLSNHWAFEPRGRDSCLIDFHVDFEFRSRLLEKAIGTVFSEAVRRMVDAFEGRAKSLYG